MQNAASKNLVLLPMNWEFHAAPDLSGRPQELINSRLLKRCDLLIGVFWTRLGTPTGEHESGTVEEIKTHVADGRPAMIYFSSRLISPTTIDSTQYQKVQEFKEWCYSKGIVSEFSELRQLKEKLQRDISSILEDNVFLRKLREGEMQIESPAAEPKWVNLSETAARVLFEAVSGDGSVMCLKSLSGAHFQAGAHTFEHDGTRREVAKFEAAIEELVNLGLLNAVGFKGEIFEVTSLGYETIDAHNEANG